MSDNQTPTNDDVAQAALNQASNASTDLSTDDEVAQSDQVAQSLLSLQNIIERNAQELERINSDLKHKRESIKNIFENDTDLSLAEQQVQQFNTEVKERKSKLQADPQVTTLKVQVTELSEQKKDLEETLSNHLVNYHALTGSTSFDTSDGDQWDFEIRAKVKTRKNRSE